MAMLSGLIYCADCGAPMYINRRKAKGKLYESYMCKIGCVPSMRSDKFDKATLEKCDEILSVENLNKAAIDFRHDYFEAVKGIKNDKDYPKLIRENQKKIDNISLALESYPESSTLVDKLKDLELEKKQLESELSFAANPYIEADVILSAIPRLVKDALELLHNPYATDERKNAILKSFVNQIEIQKDGTAKIQYHLPVVENSSQNIMRPRSTIFQFRNYVSNINRY